MDTEGGGHIVILYWYGMELKWERDIKAVTSIKGEFLNMLISHFSVVNRVDRNFSIIVACLTTQVGQQRPKLNVCSVRDCYR